MRRFLLIIMFIMFSMNAWAITAMQDALIKIEQYFSSMNGIVIESKGKEVIIDVGSSKGLIAGTKMTVFQKGEEIIHPVTGKVLGTKEGVSGELTVTKVESDFSYASYSGNVKPKVGDRVSLKLPAAVKFVFENTTAEDKQIALNSIKANPTMKEGDDYIVNIKRDGKLVTYNVTQSDGKAVYAGSSTVALVASAENSMEAISNVKLEGGRFISLAVGKVYAKNDQNYLVAATEDEVYIFDPLKNYTKVEKLSYSFNKIANIEVADLDGDGVDEIFVGNVKTGKYAQSTIFKNDGKNFKPAQTGIEYLFRSYSDNGVRKILVQQITTEGSFKGEIYHYFYKNGKYAAEEPMRGTVGKALSGFSMVEGKENLFLNIDPSNHFTVSTIKGMEYVSPDYFGDTFHKIVARQTDGKVYSPNEKGDYKYYENFLFIPPRIEVINNKYFVLVRNDIVSRSFVGSQVFSESAINISTYANAILKNVVTVEKLQPVITDIWAYNDGGKDYLVVLTSSNNWALQSAKSSITVFELTLP